MTIGDMRELIDYKNKPESMSNIEWDKMLLMIPVTVDDLGTFMTPSTIDSGVGELEMKDNILETELAMLIVPYGFYEEPFDAGLN